MKPKTFKTVVLLGTSIVFAGIAHAAYSNYTEAADAARAQFAQQNYAEAQTAAQQALPLAKTQEEKVASHLRLGIILTKRRAYAEAREQFKAILQMVDASPDDKLKAQAAIASSYGEEQDWGQSRIEFQKLINDPTTSSADRATFQTAVAATYAAQGDEADARKTLAIIVQDAQIEANFRAQTALQLGQSFINTKNYEQARNAFTMALDLAPAPLIHAMAQAAIANSYKAQGNGEAAREAYNQALIESLIQAKAYTDNKQYADARAMQEFTLTLDDLTPGTDAGLRAQIGQSLLKEGKPAEARAALETFLAKNYAPPLTPKEQAKVNLARQAAQLNIAKSYIQEGNKVQAQKVLDDLLEEKPLAPQVLEGVRQVRQLM